MPFMVICIIPVMLYLSVIYNPNLSILASIKDCVRTNWCQSSDIFFATWFYIYSICVISDIYETKVFLVSHTDYILVKGGQVEHGSFARDCTKVLRSDAVVKSNILLIRICNFRVFGQNINRVYLFVFLEYYQSFFEDESLYVLGYGLHIDRPQFQQIVNAKGHKAVPSWAIVPLDYLIDHTVVKLKRQLPLSKVRSAKEGDVAVIGTRQNVMIENKKSIGVFFDVVVHLDVFVLGIVDEKVAFGKTVGGAGEVVVVERSHSLQISKARVDILNRCAVGVFIDFTHLIGRSQGDVGLQINILLLSILSASLSQSPITILEVLCDFCQTLLVKLFELLDFIATGGLVADLQKDLLSSLAGCFKKRIEGANKLNQLLSAFLGNSLQGVARIVHSNHLLDQDSQLRLFRRGQHHFINMHEIGP